MSIRGKEIIGLDLSRYFRSRSFYFTLGAATTDAEGKAEMTVSVFPAMDLKAIAGGTTVRADVPPGQSEIRVQVGVGAESEEVRSAAIPMQDSRR